MKQITQKDLINLIKDKQENSKNAYIQALQMQPSYEKKVQEITNETYIKAYEDVIALIDSAKIVVYPEKTGKEQTTRNDELDALQYAVEGLKYMPKELTPKQDMKTKIMRSAYYSEFENDVNDFIKDKNIVDIKFSVGSDYGMMNYCVMIIYKEDKSE